MLRTGTPAKSAIAETAYDADYICDAGTLKDKHAFNSGGRVERLAQQRCAVREKERAARLAALLIMVATVRN